MIRVAFRFAIVIILAAGVLASALVMDLFFVCS